ncbi:MAG: hypothetical protein M1823_004205 [Watsoniomyces obsoletus]|nr:MAG: hypothetical protein M1823_004205 [Watsoniomyces obsoletus]
MREKKGGKEAFALLVSFHREVETFGHAILPNTETSDIQTWRSTFARSPLATPSPPPSISGRVFIASTFWNSEQVLRSHWSTTVLDFARQIGPGRVYVSIYEGGSWDGTKRELRTLDANLDKLQIPRTVVLNDTTHADLMAAPHGSAGWVRTQSRGVQPRRISHLAHARNAALEPLQELAHQGLVFDWILFLNDVIITINDLKLLFDTQHGNFAAACALDFSSPPAFYDTFALRDSNGDEVATHTYPYFRSSLSRNALLSGLAIPVQSCWNGAVVFNATPFYKDPRPLRFKAIPDSLAQAHLEGSECCIIHLENPLVPSRGIWLNPLVRVTYDLQAYKHGYGEIDWQDGSASRHFSGDGP